MILITRLSIYTHQSHRLSRLKKTFRCPSQSIRSCSQGNARIWEIPVVSGSTGKKEDKLENIYSFQTNTKNWTKIVIPDEDKKNYENRLVSSFEFSGSMYTKMLKHFLPNGYPDSVQQGYARYTILSFCGNVASTTTMVLSTQTLLLAIGVGQHAAAPISATLNWILKDGIGQFGGIVFASRISSSSNSVDADPKKWRMVSSLAMDFAMILELATAAFPGHFLLIASVANIGKNIAFLTASASRAKLHQYLAAQENLGDITGKSTSQSILASLAGTGLGIGLSPYLLGDMSSVVIGCLALSGVNQLCTYYSLKNVTINRLNRQRLMTLFDLHFQGLSSSAEGACSHIISPEEVCKHDTFLPLYNEDSSFKWLHVGCGIEMIAPNGPDEFFQLYQEEEKYILNHVGDAQNSVFITFLEDACDEDILRGLFHVHSLRAHIDGKINLDADTGGDLLSGHQSIETSSHRYMKRNFNDFRERLVSLGWKFGDGINTSVVLESENDVRIRLPSI